MDHSEYRRTVSGSRKAVLMIHGIVGTPRHFDGLLPAVPESWSVRNILLDGHGGQPEDFSRSSMKKWKAQVETCLQELCDANDQVVVVAHSMGTLLTIQALHRFPRISGLILLNVPLFPRLHPVMIPRSLKFCFGKLNLDDPVEAGFAAAAGIAPAPQLWRYLGFLPRYLELFQLCRQTRPLIADIAIPCHVFQSRTDELVSSRSDRFFWNHPVIQYTRLEESGHFTYTPRDLPVIQKAITAFLQP